MKDLCESHVTAHLPRRDGEWVRYGRWWFQPRTGEWVPVVAGGLATATWTQTRSRWRNDDGSEAAATWVTPDVSSSNAQRISSNTPSTPGARLDIPIRLRIQVDETTGVAATLTAKLKYSKNAGAYTDVNGTSSNVQSVASPNVADGAATTAQLTAPTGTFAAGSFDEVDGAVANVVMLAGQYTEYEFCIKFLAADLVVGDTIDFRIYHTDNTTLNAYSSTPRFIVGVANRDGQAGGLDPTTTMTIVIPSTVQADDDLYVMFTSRDHTSGDANATCVDDDAGGNTWASVGQSSDKKANVFWKKATSATASKTVTIAGAIGSLSGVLAGWLGAASGDPTTNMALESNASADETATGFTPTVANSQIVAAIFNYANDNAVTSLACTDPGTLSAVSEHLSAGGLDCATARAYRIQVGGPTATGNFTWAQTDGTTWSAVWAIKPPVAAAAGSYPGWISSYGWF